jgi:ATP-dependent DNA ligase
MIEKVQTQKYMVSEKTDGVRHFLAVVEMPDSKQPQVILIDRKMRIFTMPGMEQLGAALGKGTLIDGEVVRNRSWKRDIFMCFDLLHDGSKSWVHHKFPKRLEALSHVLGEKYMKACLKDLAKVDGHAHHLSLGFRV